MIYSVMIYLFLKCCQSIAQKSLPPQPVQTLEMNDFQIDEENLQELQEDIQRGWKER